MTEKVYRVVWGNWRFNLSIGGKTLLAFLLIISVLAGGFYYFATITLSSQIEKESKEELHSRLKGALRLYHGRMDQMKLGMLQAGSEDSVKRAVKAKDAAFLQKLLGGYAAARPYVELWAVVDGGQSVIGRINGRTGDFIEINGVVAKALSTGEPVVSTEIVPRDILRLEREGLASRVESSGIMQLVVTPVKSDGRTMGAFITGVLLNGNDWLPNSVYENFNAASAVLNYNQKEARVIATTAPAVKGVFSPLAAMPQAVYGELAGNKSFSGKSVQDGRSVYLAVEPVKNSKGEVIGALAIGAFDSEVNRYIVSIKDNILILAAVGVVFSLILAGLTYRDTVTPINAIARALDETAAGNLDVRVDIRTKDDFERIGRGLNQMISSVRVREERLNRFNELSKVLISSLEPEELLKKALSRMIELTNSNMGVAYVYDDKFKALNPVVWYGINEGELRKLKLGEGMPGKCASDKKTILLQDIGEEHIPIEVGFSKVMPRGIAWFPMCYKDRLVGVLAIGSLTRYNPDEIRHFEQLITQVSIALDNAFVHKEVERNSMTEPLTGLYNRRRFLELLGTEFTGAKRYNYQVAVLMIDIDDFKAINDSFGHPQGDRILTEIAQILRDRTRSTDVWSRYGGEEFIGCIAHCSRDGVNTLAEKIRKTVEDYLFPGMDGKQVTVSIGIGYYPGEGIKDLDDMIRVADENLYKAKRGGKNRVAFPDHKPDQQVKTAQAVSSIRQVR